MVVETQGDQRLDVPIWELGGKGVFAKEVQAAVLDGRADLAVHSAKDLPSVPVPGLVIAVRARARRSARRPRRLDAGRPARRRRGGHRVAAPPGPAGRGPPGPPLRRPPREHGHAARQGGRPRRDRGGRHRLRPPRPGRPHRRAAGDRRRAPAGRAGRARGRVPGRRRRAAELLGRSSTPHPPLRRRRAGVPRHARRRLLPAGRGLRRGPADGLVRSRVASSPSTGRPCSATSSRATPRPSVPRSPPSSSTTRAAAPSSAAPEIASHAQHATSKAFASRLECIHRSRESIVPHRATTKRSRRAASESVGLLEGGERTGSAALAGRRRAPSHQVKDEHVPPTTRTPASTAPQSDAVRARELGGGQHRTRRGARAGEPQA